MYFAQISHFFSGLLALANCINALGDQRKARNRFKKAVKKVIRRRHSDVGFRPNKGKNRVKYRDSKLTHLLKSSPVERSPNASDH